MKLNVRLLLLILMLPLGCPPATQPQSCDVTPALEPDLLPRRPFAESSIWNRPVPADGAFADVTEAIFGDPRYAPTRVIPDLVTVAYTDPAQPLVRIEKNRGWRLPQRATSSGVLLYERHLSLTAGIGVSWNKVGNALFNIVDPATWLADEGVGGWRCPGQPLLTLLSDAPRSHNIDVLNGDGLRGYGRGSGLPALGGLLRLGELKNGVNHALAVMFPAHTYSSSRHFVWPASAADQYAGNLLYGYGGANPNFTMGTLLAIPRDIDVHAVPWKTPQGAILAVCAQQYGWYVVDSSTAEPGVTVMCLAVEVRAALQDIGYAIEPDTGHESVNPAILDAVGFTDDVISILRMTKAVVSNVPS
ncbi:MAG: hypothetical protein HZB26_06690 [Candidatus Hydrogenedentes bacterium]|nr:hypothetical protein [Candidatus Hydrogenedentota bacterium]